VNVAQQRWALAAGSTVVAVALAGLGWWLFASRHAGPAAAPRGGFAPTGTLGFMLEPNKSSRQVGEEFDVQVDTNSLGLRGPEVTVPKPADRYRVLVLGDSFSFGWGVEFKDAWVTRLARELQTPDGRSVEVVDAGVPGWSPPQEFVFLEQRGLDLQPDLVLWQLCSNDLHDMEGLEVQIDARRLPIAVAPGTPISFRMRADWLPAIEQLGEDVRERVKAEYLAGRIDPELRKIVRAAEAARREQAGAPPEGRIAELPIEEVQRGLRTGRDFMLRYLDHVISSARTLCAGRRVELRVMLANCRSAPDGAPDKDVLGLRDWGSRQDPRMLDTSDAMNAGRVEDVYFTKDLHWAPAAQPLVAEAIARWLAEDPGLGLRRVIER
jgi:lysophospholipase L1-like esterase